MQENEKRRLTDKFDFNTDFLCSAFSKSFKHGTAALTVRFFSNSQTIYTSPICVFEFMKLFFYKKNSVN